MQETKEMQELQATVVEDITQYLRERYVATFEKIDENTVDMHFVGGRTLRLAVVTQ